jgi:hypothetical protein
MRPRALGGCPRPPADRSRWSFAQIVHARRAICAVLAEKGPARGGCRCRLTRAEARWRSGQLRGPRGLGWMSGAGSAGRAWGKVKRVDRRRGRRRRAANPRPGAGASVEASAGEALSLALQAGAQIVADPAVLDERGVAPEDLQRRAARNLTTDPTLAPVLPN